MTKCRLCEGRGGAPMICVICQKQIVKRFDERI